MLACDFFHVEPSEPELTDRMLIFGQRHLRALLTEYMRHYNTQRATAEGFRPPQPERASNEDGPKDIVQRTGLGGLVDDTDVPHDGRQAPSPFSGTPTPPP